MKPLVNLARNAVVAMLLACTALPALPQASNRYTVEIVVFRNGGTSGAMGSDAGLPPEGGDDVEISTLPTRKLGGAAARLRGTGGFRLLAHTAWSQTPTGFNSGRGVSASRLGISGSGIQGRIMLERGQYLHLGLDLVVEDGGRRYHLNEVRRIAKTDEVHYFDHPAFGVIAVVTAGG